MPNKKILLTIVFFVFTYLSHAQASYFPFSDSGTSSNLGIGTSSAFGGKLIVFGGNMGISSLTPGSTLDIAGTARMTGFQLNTNPVASYVLVSGTSGIGTWMASSTLPASAGSPGGNDVQVQYNNAGLFDGIVNSNVTSSGNLGIGTTLSANKLDIQGGMAIGTTFAGYKATESNGLIVEGNMGIGTTTPQTALALTAGFLGIGTWSDTGGHLIVGGSRSNVGIGSIWPSISSGAIVDIVGDSSNFHGIRMTNTASGNNSLIGFLAAGQNDNEGGYILHSSDFPGNENMARLFNNSALLLRMLGRFSVYTGGSNNETFSITSSGNVGIGTNVLNNRLGIVGHLGIGTGINSSYLLTTAPLGGMIVDGNVGIGTWEVNSGKLIVNGGNVGIGTALVPTTLAVQGSFTQIVNTLTDAASVATDASLGNHFRLTTTQNFTLSNPTNSVDGQRISWEIIQDATGSRTITLDTKFQLGTDIASITLTTTANKIDILTAVYNILTDKWYVVGFVKGS